MFLRHTAEKPRFAPRLLLAGALFQHFIKPGGRCARCFPDVDCYQASLLGRVAFAPPFIVAIIILLRWVVGRVGVCCAGPAEKSICSSAVRMRTLRAFTFGDCNDLFHKETQGRAFFFPLFVFALLLFLKLDACTDIPRRFPAGRACLFPPSGDQPNPESRGNAVTGTPSAAASRFIVPPPLMTRSENQIRFRPSSTRSGIMILRFSIQGAH